MGANVGKILKGSYLTAFVALAWYFLYVRNADTMFFMQDRGWWNSTFLFWNDCISVPGGLLSWAGAYLTQYFFYPAIGTSMLIFLWVMAFALAKWSFRVPNEWSFLLVVPLAALLCSDIQLGYWVYILNDVDYVFYHPLGLFAALLLSVPFWAYLPVSLKTKRWIALAWVPLIAVLFYYPLGIYALLASVLAALQTLSNSPLKGEKDPPQPSLKGRENVSPLRGDLEGSFPLRGGLVGSFLLLLLSLLLVPLLETSGTTLMRPDQPWMYGFRKFEFEKGLRDVSLEVPFYVALLAPTFFPFIRKIKTKRLLYSQSIMVLTAAAVCYSLFDRDFNDYNFHAEMRMQRGIEECRWNDVLREAAIAKAPVTREMVMFRDIALLNRGELCSKRYLYNNESVPPVLVSDSIRIRIADQAADLIYFNYGETVFAIRRAIERCMHYGYSYYTLRMLVRCAIVNGEKENARKYLRLLGRTTFQKKWAAEAQRLVADDKLLPADECFRMPLKLYNEGSELVGVDDKYVELTILKKWMYTITADPEAQEVALACAMMMRDRNCFWSQVQQYYNINPGKAFPTHVQEAMLFEVYELKMQGVNLSFVKFDDRVLQRYKAFTERWRQYAGNGMSDKQLWQALRPEFGDTYMWDYCAFRQVQTN